MKEERCICCGKIISDDPDWSITCDGVLYDAPNPYACEINDDYDDYYECDGSRAESAWDI